jgi:hypothetical protein
MLTKQQILEALRTWANQRPGLDFANYGEWKSYRAELRSITRDRADALQLMRAVELRDSITAEDLIQAFPRAFSGRLAISETKNENAYKNHGAQFGPVFLGYCTGQYWPTEYRKAAAAVLARVLWDSASADMPEPKGKITKDYGAGFKNEFDSIDGLSPGDWLRRHFRQEFGRGIQSRWFN